jgi:hypothetical protein
MGLNTFYFQVIYYSESEQGKWLPEGGAPVGGGSYGPWATPLAAARVLFGRRKSGIVT